jgi:hypothetical protein
MVPGAFASGSYERCQAIFGKIVWKDGRRLHEIGSWVVAGFSERTPYPSGKSEARGCARKSLPGLRYSIFGTFPLRGIGLTVLASASKLLSVHPNFHRAERQFDLFVSVKGNVDAVQSARSEHLILEGSAWGTNTRHVPKVGLCKLLGEGSSSFYLNPRIAGVQRAV